MVHSGRKHGKPPHGILKFLERNTCSPAVRPVFGEICIQDHCLKIRIQILTGLALALVWIAIELKDGSRKHQRTSLFVNVFSDDT